MENQTNKKTKNPLNKYIYRAIGILLLGILIGIGIAILFKKTEGIIGISSSIILSFLAVAFSYYQYYLNKIETEKRKLSDLKLMAYKDIMKGCDGIINDCYNICFELDTCEKGNFNPDIIRIQLLLDQKIRSLQNIVSYYESSLNILIKTSYYKAFIFCINSVSKVNAKTATEYEMTSLISRLLKEKDRLNFNLLETLI